MLIVSADIASVGLDWSRPEGAAIFGDGMQLAFWTSESESAGCCRLFDGPYLSERFLGEGMTIMLRKEDAVLAGAIDHALLALSRNGRLQEIYLRYFPVNLYGG